MSFDRDCEKALDELDELAKAVEKALPEAVLAGAEVLATEVKARAPQDTGELASEIGAGIGDSDKKNVAKAGLDFGDAFYWHFQEYGTVRQPARPFIRPAIKRKKKDIKAAVEDHIDRAVGKVQN